MTTRSKRLFGPTTVSTTHVLLYTCPAGETAILKHIVFVNGGPLAASAALRLNAQLGTAQMTTAVVPATGDVSRTDQFIVMHPGDTLYGISGAANLIYSGFGAELEGVAD